MIESAAGFVAYNLGDPKKAKPTPMTLCWLPHAMSREVYHRTWQPGASVVLSKVTKFMTETSEMI